MFEGIHILQQAYDAMQALKGELESTEARAKALFEKVMHMASVHDQVKQTLTDTDAMIDTLIAAKEDSDTQNADLLTQAQATQAKVKAAVAALTAPASGPQAAAA